MPNKKFYPYIAQGANAKQMFNIMQACIRAGVPFGLVGNPGVGTVTNPQIQAHETVN